jgi:hypothetical protein
MFIHSILFVILTILSATAAYASSKPVAKLPREQAAPELELEQDRSEAP